MDFGLLGAGFVGIAVESRSLIRPDHFETIARSAIPVRTGHAPDDVKTLAPDAQCFPIDQFVADVDAFHQTDDQPISTDLQRAPFRAFETGR